MRYIDQNDFIEKNINKNMINMMSSTAKAISPIIGLESLDGFKCYLSTSDFPLFNGIFINDCIKNTKEHFSKLNAYFSSKKVPFTWWWLSHSKIPLDVESELKNYEFQNIGEYSGVAAELSNLKFSEITKEIEIKSITLDEEYDIFINIISNAFQLTNELKHEFFKILSSYKTNGAITHYLGYYNGRVAGVITSYCDGKSIGLYNAATEPEFRRMGVCSALIQHIAKKGEKLGYKIIVSHITNSSNLDPLVKQLGFELYSKIRSYCRKTM